MGYSTLINEAALGYSTLIDDAAIGLFYINR